jgi:hypothetical protein
MSEQDKATNTDSTHHFSDYCTNIIVQYAVYTSEVYNCAGGSYESRTQYLAHSVVYAQKSCRIFISVMNCAGCLPQYVSIRNARMHLKQ